MVITIDSKKFPDGFPEGTTIRIEWVSKQVPNKGDVEGMPDVYKDRRLVWKGKVTGPFTRDFDPGKYVWKAHKHDPAGIDGFKDWGSFLVGMTQDQFLRISYMEPKNQKAVLATDGVMFHCQFPGCSKLSTGKVSALLHESSEHYGVDLLKSKTKKEADDMKESVDEQIAQAAPKRGPGRPAGRAA